MAARVLRYVVAAALAFAQPAWGGGLRSGASPGMEDVRPPLPPFTEPASPDFTLPTIPPPAADAPLSAGPKVLVRDIRLSGHTVFSTAELHAIVAPYEDRELSTEDLQALRVALTRHYVDRGYINSGAVLPDQTVSDGVIEYRIVEGTLTDIRITGNRALAHGYLERRIARGAGTPLDLDGLQEQMQILLQDTLVERINAELRPGAQPGESILEATVEERLPYIADASFDNALAPSLGGLRASLGIGHRSALGFGDVALYQHERGEGLHRHSFSYDVPITATDTTVGAWLDSVDSRNVEEPFNSIDIESRYDAHGLRVEHPLLRSTSRTLKVAAAFERRTSRTYLLELPFSFAPGVQDGRSEVSVIRLTQEWLARSQEDVLAIRSVFSWGVDAFSPTINATGPDGRFFTWLGQAQYARRFAVGQIILRADVQASVDPLLPLEKLAIGGSSTVRGYRENQIVRDQGFVTSAEFRVPVYRGERWPITVDVAPFVDAGGAWEIEGRTPQPGVIVSAGLGLRATLGTRLGAQFYWGYAFRAVDDPGGDPQDDGIHFAVAGSLFE